MKLLTSLGVVVLSASTVLAVPRFGTGTSKPVQSGPFAAVNQGTQYGKKSGEVNAHVKRDIKLVKRDEIDDLGKRLKDDGYEPWCREEYLHLKPTLTKVFTSTKTKTSTVKSTGTVTTTATVTGPAVTSSLTETSIAVSTFTGADETIIVTSTATTVTTTYNSITTIFTPPPLSPPPRMVKRQGAQHHLKAPPYIHLYTDWVVYKACKKIVDKKKLVTTTTTTLTRTVSKTSAINTTATATATIPGSTATVTATTIITVVTTVPGSTITSTSTTTTTSTTTLPATTIEANPCNTAEAKWHETDEGFGPCCADWTPVLIPSAYDCCVKCWNTPGCPAWFYGLPIEGSWQAGYCWTPGYIDPDLGLGPTCPSGKILIDQQAPPPGVPADLQVAQGPCFGGGIGEWEL